jgi:phenylpropionate dioxygenase-like ring-hydroxylating dioxygenase large terminal subunit
MLSSADNELLTLTGAGTPMGALFRRYWLPVLLSQELPAPDCPPVRVKVMGEDFVAFRDTKGRVGLVDPHCPHRGANLFFGRNEECGIRCVYHGWKFDVTGECLEMPGLRDAHNYEELRRQVRLKAYPMRERGEMIWAYLGADGTPPEFPDFEFCDLPDGQRFVSKKLQQCNWAQACEGALDTAHFSFLHTSVGDADDMTVMHQSEAAASGDKNRVRWLRTDGAPRFTIQAHPAGLVMGAARRADGDDLYWRISQFLLPNHALAPSTFPGENYHGQTFVPIDDVSCWIYCYTWNPLRPLTNAERERFAGGHTVHATVDRNWVPIRNRNNDYLIDRTDQKLRSFTGIKGVSEQDAAVQDSQGMIADRTREFLGPTDLGVVRFRRLILDSARDLEDGKPPASAAAPDSYRVRAGGTVAHRSKSLTDVMMTRFGDPNGAAKEGFA